MNLGKAIRLCRTQRDLNQSELAKRADISVSYLSLLERGKRDPNFSTVERISNALNVPVSILVFLAAEKEELSEMSTELQEKLSHTALLLMETTNGQASLH